MPQRYFWGVTAHRENGCHALTLYVRIAAVCGTFRRDPLFIGVYRNRSLVGRQLARVFADVIFRQLCRRVRCAESRAL